MRALPPNAGANVNANAAPYIPPNPPQRGDVPYASAADHQLFHTIACADEADFVSLMTAAMTQGARLDAIDPEGNTVIDIAIQRNSVRILQALLARGAPLPDVPPSGVDQVMRAAAQGNPDIVMLLIDTEEMLPDETDVSGCSALHYAVMAQSAPTVAVLLQRGADCNRAAVNMPEAQIEALFGERHGLSSQETTPLNIAVATHQLPVVRLLLEHGAAINVGWKNPLWIAVRRHDPAMLGVLLAHCVKTRQASAAINQAVLESALLGDPQSKLLRQLLDCHDAQDNESLDLDTALLVAVALGHVDQAALLLATGARPEPATEANRPIWTAAFELEDPAVLNLLISSCDIPFGALLLSRPDAPPRLLTELCRLAADPTRLAAHGIFPQLIQAGLPQLDEIARDDEAMPAAQRAAATALALSRTLPGIGPAQSLPADDNDSGDATAHRIPANEFQRRLEAGGHAQAGKIAEGITTRQRLMYQLATETLNSLQGALTAALSADFLRDARQRADAQGVDTFITRALSESHGVPGSLATIIAQTWSESARVIGTAAPADLHAVARLMVLTLYCKLDELATAPDSLLRFCHDGLMPTLLAARASLLKLVRQPAHFLRAIEQRHGWRPVDATALSRSVLDATGLPSTTCNAISACWEKAVSDSGRALGDDVQNVGANQRFLATDRRFANHWQQWLEENASDAGEAALPLTPAELLQALDWCESTRAGIAAGLPESRKRKPVAEAAGAPAAKTPRSE